MDLNATLFFVTVAKTGSFTEASRRLRVSKSTISEKVAELETTLGVTLMMRTTRRLKLTEAGAAFLHKAESAINSLQIAQDEASESQKTPTGTLRITAPGNTVSHVILKAVIEYRKKFPQVKIELDFSDRPIDLISESYDIAWRPGLLADSNFLAKHVGRARRILVASPGYLETKPPLEHPKDLRNHSCLTLIFSSVETIWKLRTKEGRNVSINVADSFSSNSLSALKELVLLGEGIALLPNSTCKAELEQNKYIQVLPLWATAEVPIQLVYPPQRQASAKVREMLPLLEKSLRELYL